MNSTPETISQLLADLYEIDPGLRQHEQELRPLLQKLLQHRPDQAPTPEFVAHLRTQLRERAASIPASSSPLSSSFLMQKILFALGGAAVALVIAVPLALTLPKEGTAPIPPHTESDGSPLFTYSITPTEQNAFGDLSQTTLAGEGRGGGGGDVSAISASPSAPQNMARPQSGGGGDPAAIAEYDAKLIAPGEMVEFQYSYTGELPPLTAETVGVLARQKQSTRLTLESLANQLKIGQIELSSFGNAIVESISFVQEAQKGYNLTVQMREGTVFLSPQWDKWPQPGANCRDEACYRSFQLKPGDIPADDVLLSIAADFVEEHNIDLTHYGKPEIDKLWMRDYERAEDKATAYVPDIQRVIYPLLVNDQPVFDEGGGKSGISVGINVREKQVSDLWGIQNNVFLESQYPAVTDGKVVSDYIAKLDAFGDDFYRPEGMTIRKVAVELGEPTLAYSRVYKYENNSSQELMVPSLVFPVNDQGGKDRPWRQTVIVPLAEDLLQQQGEGRDRVIPLEAQ